MPRHFRSAPLAISAAMAFTAFSASAADVLPYNNDGELFGGSMLVPAARREIIKTTTQWCGQTFQDMKWDGIAAYANWIRRHGEFLSMMETMRYTALNMPDKKKAADMAKMIKDYVPRQVASISQVSLKAIQDMPVQSVQRQTCREFIGRVSAGASDLDALDTSVAKYMRRIGGKQFEQANDARRSVFDPGSATPATDAGVLMGRWKSERSIAYFEDGSKRATAGQCSIEFSEDKVVSECVTSGKTSHIVSSWRLLAPGRYESTIVEHKLLPNLAGMVSVTDFRMADGKLHIQAFPKRDNAPANAPVLIETVAASDDGALPAPAGGDSGR